MKWKTHIAGGAVAGGVTVAAALRSDFGLRPSPEILLPFAFGFAILGSLFPDVDNRKSKAGHATGSTSTLINCLWGHRTLFHSPILYLGLFLLLNGKIGVFSVLLFGFVSGVISHIALDLLNVKGIPLFYPLPGNFHAASIREGSIGEIAVGAIMVLLAVGLVANTVLRYVC